MFSFSSFVLSFSSFSPQPVKPPPKKPDSNKKSYGKYMPQPFSCAVRACRKLRAKFVFALFVVLLTYAYKTNRFLRPRPCLPSFPVTDFHRRTMDSALTAADSVRDFHPVLLFIPEDLACAPGPQKALIVWADKPPTSILSQFSALYREISPVFPVFSFQSQPDCLFLIFSKRKRK